LRTWLIVAAIGALVLTNSAWRRRMIVRDFAEVVQSSDRFVDAGVALHVVKADPNGQQLLPGKPRLSIVRTHRFGGVIDTKLDTPARIGPSKNPTTWYCSEEQEPLILHRDSDPQGQLAQGSMGAGKTTALVMWTYLRWLENLGRRNPICEGGITAPTEARLDLVLAEFRNLYPSSWYTYRTADRVIEFADRTRVRLVSTYRQSAAQGSRVQGYNWSFGGRDEGQDQVDEHEHIEARLRSSRDGRPKQLITATAKESAEYKTLRDRLAAAADDDGKPLWIRRKLDGTKSPFVAASHWMRMRASMSARAYDLIVGARDDLPPELATYPEWTREKNLITVPEIGWTDVTELELRGSGRNHHALLGHDPGTLWHVSIPINAFVRNQDHAAYLRTHGKRDAVRPFWVVRGEINTEQSTSDAHIGEVLAWARQRHMNQLTFDGKPNAHGKQILVRADPADTVDRENANTHKSVYTKFSNAGIHIKPAAYNADNDGHGKVPKDPGIEVIKTLICSKDGERRFFVERLPDGTPAAPMLVKSIESCERDAYGKAETTRKGAADLSHWTATVRYALWAIERPRLKLLQGKA
jgi:hypothetical protein